MGAFDNLDVSALPGWPFPPMEWQTKGLTHGPCFSPGDGDPYQRRAAVDAEGRLTMDSREIGSVVDASAPLGMYLTRSGPEPLTGSGCFEIYGHDRDLPSYTRTRPDGSTYQSEHWRECLVYVKEGRVVRIALVCDGDSHAPISPHRTIWPPPTEAELAAAEAPIVGPCTDGGLHFVDPMGFCVACPVAFDVRRTP